MRGVLVCLLSLGWSVPAWASEQVWFHTQTSPSTTVVNFICPWGGGSANATEANRSCGGIPAGVVKDFYVSLSADPANGAGVQSYAFAFRDPNGDTALSCTVSEGSTSCRNTAARALLVAGDRATIGITPANTPTAVTVKWSLTFAPTTSGETSVGGSSGGTNLSNTVTNYLHPHTGTQPETTEANAEWVSPTTGTLKNLYVRLSGTPGVGNDYAFTVRRGTATGAMANTAITTTVSDSEQSDSDLVNSITVAVGDRITIVSVPTSTPTARVVRYGLTFVPTTEGDFVIPFNSDTTLSNSATNYVQWWTGSQAPNATESAVDQLAGHHLVLTGMYVKVDTAPGAGTSFDFYPRRNAARVGQTLQIAGTNTTASAFGFLIPYLFDDLVATEIVPTGTPTADVTKISYLATCAAAHIEGATIQGATIQ